jgi:4-hydroxy-2-oxoheptanedioate aldolase
MARPNGVREIWAKGGAVINSWCGIPSSFSAEVMAHAGFDSLVIDMQHGMIEYQTMVTMLQGVSTTDTVPLVRVPWNDPAHIQKALDAGAYGIVCPMINNRAEAEKFVGSILVALGMIETREAMENLDEIMSVKGLDAIYIGPSDLSISYGHPPGGDKPDEWMMDALKKVLGACKRHGVQPGIHCGAPEYAKKMIGMGFTFVTVGGDTRFVTMGAATAAAEMKNAPKPGASSSPY